MYRANQPLILANQPPRTATIIATPQPRTIIANPFQLVSQPTALPYVIRDPRFNPMIQPMVQYVVPPPPEKKKKPAPEPVVMKMTEKVEEPHHPKYYEPYYKYYDGVFKFFYFILSCN